VFLEMILAADNFTLDGPICVLIGQGGVPKVPSHGLVFTAI
jgi:hypothetical protein